MNGNKVPSPTLPPGSLAECKVDRWSAVEQYRADVNCARANMANRLIDAFDALEQLSEAEFLDIMKTANNGVAACDLLEKFRKWKGL